MQTKIGPYRIEARLGAGGMGEVFRALDERLGRRVALKHIRPEKASDPKARQRFLREARVAARLSHPSLVSVHDILEIGGTYWIVMELVEGQTLAERIEAGALPFAVAHALALDIASGLAAIHEAGILHRDLKSENIMVVGDRSSRDAPAGNVEGRAVEDGPFIRILDFGLAKTTEQEASFSTTSAGLGTPRSMSPEQALGQKVGVRSDLFALGTLYYEMFTGRSPFLATSALETMGRVCYHDPEPMHRHVPDLPETHCRLVEHLLRKEPDRRPASALDVLGTLERAGSLLRARGEAPGSPEAALTSRRVSNLGRTAPSLLRSSLVGRPGSGLERRGEQRRLTLVCCEVTAVREGKPPGSPDPETLHAILPRIRSGLDSVIRRYGGYLGRFRNHQVTIYFGYPRAREDSVERALRTALDLVALGAELQASSTELAGLALRAGVHAGPAVVLATSPSPSADSPGDRERLALGSTLDRAIRLRDRAQPGQVVVSANTWRWAPAAFDGVPLADTGPDSGAVRVLPSSPEIETGAENAPSIPMRGRDRELALLRDRLRAADAGSGQVVLISGAAGSGKSRLVRALRQAMGPERRWWSAQGSALSRQDPLTVVASLVDSLIGQAPVPGSGLETREALHALLERHDLPADEIEPTLSPLLTLPSSRPGWPPPGERSAVLGTLTELILELADQGGTQRGAAVLVIESLQWVDGASLDLVERLIDRGSGAPLLVLLTSRPSFLPPWAQQARETRIHLDPLPPDAASLLLADVDTDSVLDDAARSSLVERAAGVPLYLEALARDQLRFAGYEGTSLGSASGEGSAGSESLTLPGGLMDSFQARLDAVGTARDLASRASVLGREIRRADLLLLGDLDRAALDHEIHRLLDSEIWVQRDTDDEFSFAHPLLREAALGTLLDEDRRLLHEMLVAEPAQGAAEGDRA